MAEDGKASRLRRRFLLMAPAALAPVLAQAVGRAAQLPEPRRESAEDKAGDLRLPSGKRQVDEILKADHEQNLREARELASMAASFEGEMEKTDRFVLSMAMVKKLDDMEKLVRRIRTRLKK